MSDILYDFVDLDNEESFVQLGNKFGGKLTNGCFHFNNEIVSGELTRMAPENGLWIRKWKMAVTEKIVLRKHTANPTDEVKYCLVYFLNPSIFTIKKEQKDFTLPIQRNNIFFTSNVPMEFGVIPKQPFYVLDIAFTSRWLLDQMADGDNDSLFELQNFFDQYNTNVSLLPCSDEEYRTLRELEIPGAGNPEYNILFIRSRVYKLISEFFHKFISPKNFEPLPGVVHYDQIMEAERIVLSDLKKLMPVEKIATLVSLSSSTLLRQFRHVFGKSLQDYYVEQKMEIARTMIITKKVTIKHVAEMMGYRQVSAFIETFTKTHGYSPGTLKNWTSEDN